MSLLSKADKRAAKKAGISKEVLKSGRWLDWNSYQEMVENMYATWIIEETLNQYHIERDEWGDYWKTLAGLLLPGTLYTEIDDGRVIQVIQ